jgi:hypothetical protein
MIVWGGYSNQQDRFFNTGGRYRPSTDSWTATTTVNAPNRAEFPTAVWTGSRMIVWGGFFSFADPLGSSHSYALSTGGEYCATSGPPTVRLANISTRAFVKTGDNVMIGGLIVTGSGLKVILRAIGPSLSNSGIAGALQDPVLELHDSAGALLASNDNWMDAPNKQAIIDSGLAPSHNLESAILTSLNPGSYTAVIRGVNNGTGPAVVEAYDLDQIASSKFGNISTRGFVQTGNDVMIAGTIVLGSTPQHVLIRGLGPSLPFTGTLADPYLELRDSSGTLLRSCDNWHTCGQEADIIATGAPPTNDAEAAIVANLSAGAYTAIVGGVNNTTGVALVEIYALTN